MGKPTGPHCTLTLPLVTELWQEHALAKKFRCAERMYNNIVRHAIICLAELSADPKYQRLLVQYRNCPDTDEGQKRKKKISAKLNKTVLNYGLSEYDFHEYVAFMKNKSFEGALDINTAQKVATRVWKAVEKVLYSDGKELHFKSAGDIESLEGKNNKSGIKYNAEFQELRFMDMKIPVKIRKKDTYAQLMLTHEICYCRIIRKPFKSGWRYFLQLVLKGIPEKKPKLGNGKVGIDMGPSTIAAIGDNDGLLIAHGNNMESGKQKNKTVVAYNKEIVSLVRKLERQRRLANPDNYNEDGTIKKGKKTWTYSKNYNRTKFALKATYRKKSAFIEQLHNTTANKILSLGNQFTTEPMNWKALQKKNKKTEKSDKTIQVKTKDGTIKTITKYKKKKRFGKSLNNHSPALLEEIIIRKLAYHGLCLNYVNLPTYRASQYNPETGIYEKCDINTRVKEMFNRLIQRDLLSAFLLQNPLEDLMQIDIKAVKTKIDNFIKIHDEIVKALKNIPDLPKCVGF